MRQHYTLPGYSRRSTFGRVCLSYPEEHFMQTAMLLLVAFLSGAILMALELIGFRVVGPEFGGAIFVWGSLIGVFLAALSIGYYLGGRAADRWPRAGMLSAALIAAGVWIALLPRWDQVVCIAVADSSLDVRYASLVAALVLFLVPGALMGLTSPFVIRLTASRVDQIGRTAGHVFAVSTVGSIVGTLGAAFYLMNWLRTSQTLLLLGISLMVTGLLTLTARVPRKVELAVLALVLIGGQPSHAAKERVLLERDSSYHRLFVTEDDHYRWLRADNIWHTQMALKDPQGRGLPYADYVDLAFLYNPNIKHVLVIGLGGGTVPKRFVRDYPKVWVDVVEIDPAVITIAKRYFHIKEGPRLKLHEADGRRFLRRTNQTWDLILLDAYYADTVPFFLTTREFFTLAKSRLNPGGILVNNVVGQVSGPRSKFFRSVYQTMAGVFPQLSAFTVPESGDDVINIEVFGINARASVSVAELRKRATQLQGKLIKDDQLVTRLDNYLTTPVTTKDVPVLEDDYAPVDALLHLW